MTAGSFTTCLGPCRRTCGESASAAARFRARCNRTPAGRPPPRGDPCRATFAFPREIGPYLRDQRHVLTQYSLGYLIGDREFLRRSAGALSPFAVVFACRGTLARMGRRRIHSDSAARSRAWRARQRLDRLGLPPERPPLGDDARAVVTWAAERLRVPPGHPHAGRPFVLADWQIAVLDDCLRCREVLLCIARKNAKSALISVISLAHLCGPLRRPGWRCGVLSANRGKAGELLRQCEEIAQRVRAQGADRPAHAVAGKVARRRRRDARD